MRKVVENIKGLHHFQFFKEILNDSSIRILMRLGGIVVSDIIKGLFNKEMHGKKLYNYLLALVFLVCALSVLSPSTSVIDLKKVPFRDLRIRILYRNNVIELIVKSYTLSYRR